MEKRKETTQKMEAVAKKLIRHSFLESVEKWPPECIRDFKFSYLTTRTLPSAIRLAFSSRIS